MFEAMRLSTHVLSSPCTITRSEACCLLQTAAVEGEVAIGLKCHQSFNFMLTELGASKTWFCVFFCE